MNPQTITVNQPTRETMRLTFELALGAAKSPGAKQNIQDAYNFFEVVWMQQDQQQEEAKVAPPPKGSSAVERHGVGSQQAKAAQEKRRAKRTAEKEKVSAKPTEGQEEAKE